MPSWFKRMGQQTGHNKSWVLLFGPTGAGKTTLLTHAVPPIQSPTKKSPNKATKTVDYWFNDEVMFIDPAGTYCFAHASEKKASAYWRQWLRTLKKNKKDLTNVCFVIDLPHLLYPTEAAFQQLLERFAENLTLLSETWSPLYLHIIVTQCDYIFGFPEFFHNLSQEDQEQPFGFSLIDSESELHRDDIFKQRFEEFIEMINRRWLTRLHHEPNKNRRIRIYDLPFQLEWLMLPLTAIIERIPENPGIVLSNVFFCSSKQTTETVNLLSGNFSKAFKFKPTVNAPLIKNQRALFIPEMLQCVARPAATPLLSTTHTTPSKKWRIIGYLSAMLIIAAGAICMRYYYKKNMIIVNNISAIMAENQKNKKNPSENNAIHQLNTLYALQKKLNYASGENYIGFHPTTALKNKVDSTYQFYLHHGFVDYLRDTLVQVMQKQITSTSAEHSALLYETLKIYLLLATTPRQPEVIKQWFRQYWENQFPDNPTIQKQLYIYLNKVLAFEHLDWPIDERIVHEARERLNQEPVPDLGLQILHAQHMLATTSFAPYPATASIVFNRTPFPVIYAKELFSTIYNQEIPLLAHRMIQEASWVLGTIGHEGYFVDLANNMKQLYLKNYLEQWKKNMSSVTFLEPKTIDEEIAQIQLVTNPHSMLWNIHQDAIATARAAGASSIVDEYHPTENDERLNHLLSLAQLLEKINLQKINNASTGTKAAYDAALLAFQQHENTDPILPEPLLSWSRSLEQNSYAILLRETKNYLDTVWEVNIAPFYRDHIENRYPLDRNSKNDISMEDFNTFFGPGGLMQSYFNQISPFIDTTASTWVLRTHHGATLAIELQRMDFLMKASTLQKMFYSTPFSAPLIHFSLKPLTLSTGNSDFTLNIGGQMVHYARPIDTIPANLNWPTPEGHDFVTIGFKHQNPSNLRDPSLTITGPWAWLRLLDQAKIDTTDDPSKFTVTFSLGPDKTTFELSADNPNNPYSFQQD